MMPLKYTFKTALEGLRTNKSRSLLTILGIVIGITSVTLIMSISQGANDLILGEFETFGSKIISIEPGREPTGPSDFSALFSDSLKQKDLDALRNIPTYTNIVPEVVVPGSVSFEGETFTGITLGANEIAADIFDLEVEEGDLFTDSDVRSRASVVVIGSDVKEELFGLSDAVGNNIKIKDRNFRVVGVFKKKGNSLFFNTDELVLVPYTTAMQYLLGQNYFNEIIGEATSEDVIDETVFDIEATLRVAHNIDDPEKDDFYVVTQEGAAETVGLITGIMAALLASVAAISLVVGGIGIMNIMLVSVTERTREIGLRKALGATNRDIQNQFIAEAVGLTVAGGFIGVVLGTLLSFIASIGLTSAIGADWPFSLPFSAAVLGFVVSASVGLIFGIYPARQAAKKSPIEALRYE
ncbi:multidrug ABC transporter substrate-binding protein [bacterium]|nr:multidrug ABC transporter substrate-binding protein [bacterium]|tara:strand:+ start:10898 stop:12130 length:1233 start_codon:yes stop_codon:yes gene_type:complete